MKIIHLIPAYKPAYIYGGPTMSVAMLCEALVEAETEHKIEVEVFTTTANGKSELDVKPGKKMIVDGVPVTYFKRLTKDHTHFSPALLWALYKEIKEQRARTKDLNNQQTKQLLIHIHSWWNLVSILSCWLAKLYQVPVVLTPRGMLTQYTTTNRNTKVKSLIHRFLGNELLSYCHIHATSEQEKKDIIKIINPKSVTVIPNLVSLPTKSNDEPTTHNPPHPITHNHFNLLFLSRIEEKKGLELLFEALATLDINWKLSIAGSGQESYIESLKQISASLKLNDSVEWLGQINNQDKFELMAQHDLLVLTSYNENFANVVIESLSVGTAVLVSNQVGLSKYITEKRLGYVTSLNVSAIVNKIKTAYLEKDNIQRIRMEGAKIIYDDFNPNALVQEYIKFYKAVT